jgi:hypothetical protein
MATTSATGGRAVKGKKLTCKQVKTGKLGKNSKLAKSGQ